MIRRLLLVCLALLLAACASPGPEIYRDEKPVLDLRTYFDGTVDAWGFFRDRSGKVVKRFTVEMRCTWNGNVGTLDESFRYSDGTTSRRVWTVTKVDEHTYTGRADDVVGEARGEAYGNALRWRYVLKLPVDGKVYEVDFDDWMYLMDEQVMLNTSAMSKFGWRLGEVVLSFRKRPQ
jgi:starvation-inducible outer membrane lipoprotein